MKEMTIEETKRSEMQDFLYDILLWNWSSCSSLFIKQIFVKIELGQGFINL